MNAFDMSAPVWEGDRAPFAKAFVAAQKATEAVKKASSNPAFRSKYADLAACVEAVVPALNEAGIGVLQFPTYDGERAGVTTTLLHDSGSSVTATLHLRPTKPDPQGVGSAITYARRYSLLAIAGAAPEDDDGNAASAPGEGGKRFNPATGRMVDPMSPNQARKDGRGARYDKLRHEITDMHEVTECLAWGNLNAPEIATFPEAWRNDLRGDLAQRMTDLRAAIGEDEPRFDAKGNEITENDEFRVWNDRRAG